MTSTRAPRSRNTAVSKAARAGESSRRTWIIAAAVLVVALAGVMAFALSQEESPSTMRGSQTADVTITGEPLPPLPQGPSEAVGLPMPEASGTSLGGEPMVIGNDGTPKVIGFFTHWCPACQAEVPEVSSWANDGNLPDDVDVVAVNTGVDPSRPNYPATAWLERENWNIPTLLDSGRNEAANAFGLSAYPFWVAVDADGTVVNQMSGQIGISELEALIDQARAGAAG